jgi:hypothetical protein
VAIFTREALFKAAWSRPLTEIASEIGISSTGLRKICDRHDIPTPGRGYWAQVRAGEVYPKPKLRPPQDPRMSEVHIESARPLPEPIQKARADAREKARTGLRRSAAERNPQADAGDVPDELDARSAPELPANLRMTAQALQRAKPDRDGFIEISGRGRITARVGPDSVQASLRFVAALLKGASNQGWAWASDSEYSALKVAGETLPFRVIEQPRKTLHQPTDKELKLKADRDRWGGDSQPWRTWDLSPSGRLALVIETSGHSGLRRTWSQRSEKPLEASLEAILAGFAGHAAAVTEERLDRERRQREFEAAEARRKRIQAFEDREGRRSKFVEAMASVLADRDRLQSILRNLDGLDPDERGPPGLRSWLERKLRACDARLAPNALRISARHAKVVFEEPCEESGYSRWYSPEIELHLWVAAEEEGRVVGVSELEWGIREGLVEGD